MKTAPPFPSWLRECPGGAVLDIAVQPGARSSGLVGLHDGALRLRISAPAIDGRGNVALCEWLADALGCARRDVRLLRGERARRKQVEVDVDATRVLERLGPLLERAQAEGPRG